MKLPNQCLISRVVRNTPSHHPKSHLSRALLPARDVFINNPRSNTQTHQSASEIPSKWMEYPTRRHSTLTRIERWGRSRVFPHQMPSPPPIGNQTIGEVQCLISRAACCKAAQLASRYRCCCIVDCGLSNGPLGLQISDEREGSSLVRGFCQDGLESIEGVYIYRW